MGNIIERKKNITNGTIFQINENDKLSCFFNDYSIQRNLFI